MDGDDRQRRQQIPSNYNTPPLGGQRAPRGATDRYRQQPPLVTSRDALSNPEAGRSGTVPSYGGYGYEQQQYGQPLQGGSIQGGQMPYQSDYSQEVQRQQQPQQHYGQYGTSMVYNVPQPQAQSPYEPMQQYQPRQSASIDALPTHFGVPQYYAPNEPPSAGVPAVPQQYIPPQIQQSPYSQPSPPARGSLPQNYSPGEPSYSLMESSASVEQQSSGGEQQKYDEDYANYQSLLKQIYEDVVAGNLRQAGQNLKEISHWLLGHVVRLGTSDERTNLCPRPS